MRIVKAAIVFAAVCMVSPDVGAENAPKATQPDGGWVADDASITKRVIDQLRAAAPGATHVSVSTKNNVVTLSGWVDSEAMRERVVGLATATDGVAGVNDQLVVVPPPPARSTR